MDYSIFERYEKNIPRGGVRTRFAPSPTGYMHVGNLRTAIYAYLIARKNGGKFLLRIEDTDSKRNISDAVEVILRTMADCGLSFDEGPTVGGPVGPYVQSERRNIYRDYAMLLIEKGGAYRCYCDKKDAEEESEEETAFLSRCGCSELSEDEIAERIAKDIPFVVRQRIPTAGETTFSDEIFGDITAPNDSLDEGVLLKSDGLPTYNFANVVDDHLMGITHVVRGTEYLSSAPKYNLLYESFGWEIPKYIHCSPVMRDAVNKMSKRHGDPSYEDLIKAGYLTSAIVNYVVLLGWSPRGERELFSLPELEEIFDISGLSKSPAIFDIQKLRHFNSEYIRSLPQEDFFALARPYIESAVKSPSCDLREIAKILQMRCEVLTDIPEKLDFFDVLPEYDTELFVHKKSKTDEEISYGMLMKLKDVLTQLSKWDEDEISGALAGMASSLEVKNSVVMWPLRIALAGKAVTPGGAVEICSILGREEALRRIGVGIEKLESKVK